MCYYNRERRGIMFLIFVGQCGLTLCRSVCVSMSVFLLLARVTEFIATG